MQDTLEMLSRFTDGQHEFIINGQNDTEVIKFLISDIPGCWVEFDPYTLKIDGKSVVNSAQLVGDEDTSDMYLIDNQTNEIHGGSISSIFLNDDGPGTAELHIHVTTVE